MILPSYYLKRIAPFIENNLRSLFSTLSKSGIKTMSQINLGKIIDPNNQELTMTISMNAKKNSPENINFSRDIHYKFVDFMESIIKKYPNAEIIGKCSDDSTCMEYSNSNNGID